MKRLDDPAEVLRFVYAHNNKWPPEFVTQYKVFNLV